MKKIFLSLFSLTLLSGLECQTFNWARSLGNTVNSGVYGFGITIDKNNSVISVGYHTNTGDFDPGINVFNLTCDGQEDAYVSKLDASGNFLWAKQFSGISNERALSVASDESNNVLICGYFQGLVDFDPGPSVTSYSAQGQDPFITKLNSNGNLVWAKQLKGQGSSNAVQANAISIATDLSDNVYVAGYFQNSPGFIDFDPGPSTFTLSGDGTYILKLDPNGNFLWAKRMPGLGANSILPGLALSVDATNNLYITGTFMGTGDFDPGVGTYSLTSNGLMDSYVVKLDGNANFQWARSFGGVNYDYAHSVKTDQNGNVYTCGFFQNTVDFDPGVNTFNITSNGNFDCYIHKLDATGNFVWANGFGDFGADVAYDIDIDGSGNIWCTGYFSNTPDFDPSSTTFTMASSGLTDHFLLNLSGAGAFIWSGKIGSNQQETGASLKCNNSCIYATGYYSGSSDFDMGLANFIMTPNLIDGFVYSVCQPTVTGVKPLDNSFNSVAIAYPNPCSSQITLEVKEKCSVTVYDVFGKEVHSQVLIGGKNNINLNECSTGTYFIQIKYVNALEVLKISKIN